MNDVVWPASLTAVGVVSAVPVTVTTVPSGPLVGENEVILGATLKAVALVPVPPAS